jgi:protein-disulfide isomerase
MSFSNFLQFLEKNFGTIVIVLVVTGVSFFVGSMWKENKMLATGMVKGNTAQVAQAGNGLPGGDVAAPVNGDMDKLPAVDESDHVKGASNPKVTIVEYSDYECPFCQSFHVTMEQVMEEYGDQVAWVYRHYPLGFHANAQKAAEASECVAELGGNDAFWAYTDAMFIENEKLGGRLQADSYEAGVTAAGVSLAAVETCLENGDFAQNIKDEMTAGAAAGVTGTPGSFIITEDGVQEMIPGALPFAQVQSTLEQYL